MAPINGLELLGVSQAEVIEAFKVIQTNMEMMSNVDDSSIYSEEHGLLKQKMGDFVQATSSHLIKLKRRLNELVDINKLPREILEYIILFAHNHIEKNRHPYISYSWVCSHWRSTLVHNPAFWALIRHISKRPPGPFDLELVERSKSAKLDVILSQESPSFLSTLQPLFSKEPHRIRRLSLYPDERLMQLVLSGKHFPSLQGFALNPSSDHFILHLSSILAASEHLRTLELTLWNNAPMHNLKSIFTNIRDLKLTLVTSHEIVRATLDLLHQSVKLQSLQLRANGAGILGADSSRIILPELQYLSLNNSDVMDALQTPKLSSLDGTFGSFTSNYPLLEDFDFSSIKHLYIRCPQSRRNIVEPICCLLGSKERIECGSSFSLATDILFESPHKHPRDCFHLKFPWEKDIVKMLQGSFIIPRLTNLVELYLLIPHTLTKLEDIIAQVPSVEKVVIQRGNKLLDFIRLLSNTSLCPRLRYLSFMTFSLSKSQSLEKYAKDVGKALTQCLQCRQKASAHHLNYIILRNCPPLPNTWLRELQKLGTEVVTEQNIKDVIIKKRKADRDEKFSDVEI
ncbi:hypothetical protein Clacol_006925 [Clathrus columnatus]|uniref:F-box domain-containing protein n=1 Tax=Clathrus columnatus TaxID=1419009 RepID=A0AAV5AJM2_9AGAM|nr:hypothetical protein Clacol_006925 [Clathrus columnatus]